MTLDALDRGAREGEVDASIPLPLLLISTFAMGVVPQIARRVAGEQLPFPDPDQLAEAALGVLFGGIAPKS